MFSTDDLALRLAAWRQRVFDRRSPAAHLPAAHLPAAHLPAAPRFGDMEELRDLLDEAVEALGREGLQAEGEPRAASPEGAMPRSGKEGPKAAPHD
jgi:hypothetical protein